MNKFFSIIIPTYNSKQLKKGLDSIESQPAKDLIEVIIVDDNSTDDSYLNILSNYTFDYKIIKNTVNLGPGGARQVGLDVAQGKWITFLDHDDYFNPKCFHIIKEQIEHSQCTALFETQIIVAKDEYWPMTQQYVTDSGLNCMLHGKFFNKDFLVKNNIKFNSRIYAQEDVYFLAVIEGIIGLCPDYDYKSRVSSPIITYYWFLWDNSTSHKKINGKEYILYYFKDYITCNYDSYRFVYDLYPNEKFKNNKLTSCLLYCYLFYEKFYYVYSKKNIDISDVLEHCKNFKNIILDELNITHEELIEIMNDEVRAEMYLILANKVNECSPDFSIPQHTLTQFLNMLK